MIACSPTVPAEAYPNLVRVGSEPLASGFDCGAEFELGLDLILDGIDRALAATVGRAQSPT